MRASRPGWIVPRHRCSSHCGANTPWEVPTRKRGSLTGKVPTLPTVRTSSRAGGAPNQVNSPLEPVSRLSVRSDSRPPDASRGNGSTECPATWKAASAAAFGPVMVETCTTHGHGTGGSATGNSRRKSPLSSAVTARPSPLAQVSVPPGTPRDGTD